ncbi:MAG TPA: futalosine hydrolase [Phycisphaerales bacterium]|nr:futalosine hydrolase [Phycisphaerales bacterium]HRQ76854.1 futalosine hydrolase [Phycisphaerales bacterium]
MLNLLIITAVKAEADAIGLLENAHIVAAGVGRTNAAAATTEMLVQHRHRRPFDAVISAGIAGALPGSELSIGDALLASTCIYVEEGIITGRGFANMAGLGFPLGDFEGNAVPVDEQMLDALGATFRIGPIATVATCSGTNAAAEEVVRRTGALAEAMEGAAVVHAARRLRVPAIELRAISNTTGDRADQQWDLQAGFASLGDAIRRAVEILAR